MINRLKKILKRLYWYSPLPVINEIVSGRHFTILMFHRVVDQVTYDKSVNNPMMVTIDEFKAICTYVKRYCNIIGLDDSLPHFQKKIPFPLRTTAFTFDDGYLDVYENAFPLMRSRGIPSTIFLPTDFIGNPQQWLWWDEIDWAFMHGHQALILSTVSKVTGLKDRIEQVLSGDFLAQKDALTTFIRNDLYAVTEEQRRAIAHAIAQKRLEQRKSAILMNWEQIKKLTASRLVATGSHTASHCFFDSITAVEIEKEIRRSFESIRDHTSSRCEAFCYPSGKHNQLSVKSVRDFGCTLAVSTRPIKNSHLSDSMLLGRIDGKHLVPNTD